MNLFETISRIVKIKNISFSILLLTFTCLIFFTNCSITDDPLVDPIDIASKEDSNEPYKYTANPPPDQFPDPDDPETRDDIISPEGLDIVNWTKTSEITNVNINIENGQVCIPHTKAGQWNPTQNVNAPSAEDPVEGNAWIIVPLDDDKDYAAPYDWLSAEGPCHMLNAETLSNLYEQLPQRTGVTELARWKPVSGDRIGFLVSGLAKSDLENVKERSNMLIITLPDANGEIPTEVEEPCSQDPESSFCLENCHVPNKLEVINSIAERNADSLTKAHQLYTEKQSNESESITSEDERWEFMDRVAQVLHGIDDRFGYTCVHGDCNDISTHQIAYKCEEDAEEEDAETTENIATVSILTQDGETQWQLDTLQNTTTTTTTTAITATTTTTTMITASLGIHGWIYPREGSEDYSDCTFFPASSPLCQPDDDGGEGDGDDDGDDDNQDLLALCTQEQLDHGYATHPKKNECLPRCFIFGASNASGVETAEGDECDDTANYHILPIQNTFDDKCCRRYSKTACPPGHNTHNGVCYPTCQKAAELAGHTNMAKDNPTGNYVLHEKQTLANDANCRELDEYGPNGYNDWQDFSFYDPYTFKTRRNNRNTIYKIVVDPNDDYLCCIRDNPNITKTLPYGSDGWTQEERNRFPETMTPTTTSPGSN